MKYFNRIWIFLVASFFVFPASANCDLATDGDLFADKDNPSASDSNTGSASSPFRTIQKLVDSLQPGQCGFVKETSEPYFEDVRKSGSDFGGITIDNSGTITSPIVVSGYPGERPVIDIGRRKTTELNKDIAGFFVRNADYVTIRNFEIREASSSGVFMAPGIDNDGIIVEDMHLHHIYGADNVGGVRLDNCNRCIVRNNLIHDIYYTRENSNPLNSVPYGLHAGVHGYHPSESIIENNLIHTVARGVFQKQANDTGLASHTVRYNIFRDIAGAAYEMNLQGGGAPSVDVSLFHHNLVVDASRGIYAPLAEAGTQGRGVSFYNNTLVRTSEMVYISNMEGLQVYNNVVFGRNSRVDTSFVFATVDAGNWQNTIATLDYNFYSTDANQQWMLERYTSAATNLNGLSQLRSRGYGQNSEITDINFASATDFSLVPVGQWSAAGRSGDQVGAFGGRPVGPTNGAAISIPTPMNDWGE